MYATTKSPLFSWHLRIRHNNISQHEEVHEKYNPWHLGYPTMRKNSEVHGESFRGTTLAGKNCRLTTIHSIVGTKF